MFEDLKNTLDSEKRQEQDQNEAWENQTKLCEKNAQSYEEMVMNVLNQLIKIAYPESYLHQGRLLGERGKYTYTWEVAHSYTASSRGGPYTETSIDLAVNLIFKGNAIPSHFECVSSRQDGHFLSTVKKKSPLNQERLEKALTSLYRMTR